MVYVVTSTYVNVDSGDFNTNVEGVYADFDRATILMRKLILETQHDFRNYTTEMEDYVEGDMSWSIWEKGEYMSHHCDIQITECEIHVN